MAYRPIDTFPTDGTQCLTLVNLDDPNEVPAVAEWYDPATDGVEGEEPCLLLSEPVLADMQDENVSPNWWAPLPLRVVAANE